MIRFRRSSLNAAIEQRLQEAKGPRADRDGDRHSDHRDGREPAVFDEHANAKLDVQGGDANLVDHSAP
jgi:hypothetical protein